MSKIPVLTTYTTDVQWAIGSKSGELVLRKKGKRKYWKVHEQYMLSSTASEMTRICPRLSFLPMLRKTW